MSNFSCHDDFGELDLDLPSALPLTLDEELDVIIDVLPIPIGPITIAGRELLILEAPMWCPDPL